MYFNQVFPHEAFNLLVLSLTNMSPPFSSGAAGPLRPCASELVCGVPAVPTLTQRPARPGKQAQVLPLSQTALQKGPTGPDHQGLQIHFLSQEHVMESSEL